MAGSVFGRTSHAYLEALLIVLVAAVLGVLSPRASAAEPPIVPVEASSDMTTIETSTEPNVQQVPLDQNCQFVVPDFTGHTLVLSDDEYEVMTQDPPAGTVFYGPAFITVLVFATGAEEGLIGEWDIELIDQSAPTIELTLQATTDILVGPTGFPYVTTPGEVGFSVVTQDCCDPNPLVTLVVDGVVSDPGSTIREVGIHTIEAIAVDQYGNRSRALAIIEIRPRKFLGASMVVSDLVFDGDETSATMHARILLAGSDFDPMDVHLGTIQLRLYDHEWNALSAGIPVAGVDPCNYDCEQVVATYVDGYWELLFEATGLPSDVGDQAHFLHVVGRASPLRAAEDFDFAARATAVVDPNPLSTLALLGVTFPAPSAQPVCEAMPQCEWKWALTDVSGPDLVNYSRADTCEGIGVLGGMWQESAWLRSHLALIDRIGFVSDSCSLRASNVAESVLSRARIEIWLEPDCCTQPRIVVEYAPSFKARVEINSPARAVVAGWIKITDSGGTTAVASGAVGIGTDVPEQVTIGDSTISVTTSTESEFEQIFADVATAAHNTSYLNIVFAGAASINLWADAQWIWNYYGSALGRIDDPKRGISVTARCLSGCNAQDLRITLP